MIEVFKTNVTDQEHASILINRIRETFLDYDANFDLGDCDKILRVKCQKQDIASTSVVRLVKELGFHAELLPD
jgi:hypothetical protein